MKYLKRYNESVDKNIIKDILLEIEDLGIDIHCDDANSMPKFGVIWYDLDHVTNRTDPPTWGEIKDCIFRLEEYLKDNLVEIKCYSNNYYYFDSDKEYISDSDKVEQINILYKK